MSPVCHELSTESCHTCNVTVSSLVLCFLVIIVTRFSLLMQCHLMYTSIMGQSDKLLMKTTTLILGCFTHFAWHYNLDSRLFYMFCMTWQVGTLLLNVWSLVIRLMLQSKWYNITRLNFRVQLKPLPQVDSVWPTVPTLEWYVDRRSFRQDRSERASQKPYTCNHTLKHYKTSTNRAR